MTDSEREERVENEIQPGLPDEHSEIFAFTPHGQRPPQVDREQIRRDAEAILASEPFYISPGTLARHCLTLLAELEQAEQQRDELVEALREIERGTAPPVGGRALPHSALADIARAALEAVFLSEGDEVDQ